ncbi:mercuric reductase, partial [Candidatus Pacearchaeota archaeon CG10_big_fil_rev_8_21_14_0_10_31_9]
MKKHNIIIVGAGSGGLNIAGFMNKAGFKVLLIDKSDKNIGGDCLNFGCVPSKALIHVARIIHNAKLSEEFGFSINGKLNMKKVIEYV